MNIKPSLYAIAIVFSAIAASAHAESELAAPGPSTLTRAEVQADAAAWRKAGLADQSAVETPNIYSSEYQSRIQNYLALRAQTASGHAQIANPAPGGLTRAEVKADAAAWRKAGLADQSPVETPNIYGKDYQSRLQNYLASRA